MGQRKTEREEAGEGEWRQRNRIKREKKEGEER